MIQELISFPLNVIPLLNFYLGNGFPQKVSEKKRFFAFQQIARGAERFPVKTV
jgi:hypothetical protein